MLLEEIFLDFLAKTFKNAHIYFIKYLVWQNNCVSVENTKDCKVFLSLLLKQGNLFPEGKRKPFLNPTDVFSCLPS